MVFQPDLLEQNLTMQPNLIKKKKLQDSQVLIKPPTTTVVQKARRTDSWTAWCHAVPASLGSPAPVLVITSFFFLCAPHLS